MVRNRWSRQPWTSLRRSSGLGRVMKTLIVSHIVPPFVFPADRLLMISDALHIWSTYRYQVTLGNRTALKLDPLRENVTETGPIVSGSARLLYTGSLEGAMDVPGIEVCRKLLVTWQFRRDVEEREENIQTIATVVLLS